MQCNKDVNVHIMTENGCRCGQFDGNIVSSVIVSSVIVPRQIQDSALRIEVQ